jgi:hypothetical protein
MRLKNIAEIFEMYPESFFEEDGSLKVFHADDMVDVDPTSLHYLGKDGPAHTPKMLLTTSRIRTFFTIQELIKKGSLNFDSEGNLVLAIQKHEVSLPKEYLIRLGTKILNPPSSIDESFFKN